MYATVRGSHWKRVGMTMDVYVGMTIGVYGRISVQGRLRGETFEVKHFGPSAGGFGPQAGVQARLRDETFEIEHFGVQARLAIPLRPMIDQEEKRHRLVEELIVYFESQEFNAVAARNIEGYPQPKPIHNDGFGDQEDKQPYVLAFDRDQQCFLVGIVRTGNDDFESEGSLTEYNVFLDQADERYGKPYRLYIIAPSSTMSQLTALITHYIHRDYWNRITFVSSQIFAE